MAVEAVLQESTNRPNVELFGYDFELVRKYVTGEIVLPPKEKLHHDQRAFLLICKRFGLEVPFDFYNTMDVDHVVEIYDVQGKAIYKNLHFFKFSTYSIEDHINKSFFELFSRPAEIEQQIMAYLSEEFVARDYSLKKPKIPFHYLKEKCSLNRSIFGLDIKTFQLIKSKETGDLFGFANMIKVTEYDLTKN